MKRDTLIKVSGPMCAALLAFCLALGCLTAAAQTGAKLRGEGGVVRLQTASGRTLPLYSDYAALVIGVGGYQYWPQLQGPTRDMEEVARVLRGLGFKVKTLKDPDSRQLEDALYDLPYGLGAQEDRGLLIYYSGHGATERLADGTKLGYLVAKDCPLSSDRRRFGRCAVSMSDVEEIALKIKSRHVLMVFDSCFSGSLFNMFKAEPSAYLEEKIAQPVRSFITAGTEDEKVPDRSTFKTVFVQGLGRGYADVNRDGFVTGTELGKYLAENVVNYTRKRQHPQYGKINKAELDKGDFVFALSQGVVSPPRPQPKPPKSVTQPVPPPPPVQPSGSADLHVTTEPGEAVIYLDGQRKGRAPQTFQMIPAGSYKLMARKGYLVASQDVDLARDDLKRVHLKLEHEKGDLRLFSQPSGAMLNLDGKQYSATPVSIKGLEAGSHKVVLNKMQGGDLYEYQGELLIKPGSNRQTLQLVKSRTPQRISNSLGQKFVLIQPGSFEMGSNSGYSDEKPVHRVTISKPFYLQSTEVTQGQWRAVMGSNPSNFKGDDLPVEQVSWNDAQEFIRKLNAKEGSDKYRLPTEAEWEYAARAGSQSKYCFGDDAGRLGDYAWYDSNSGNKTHAVGQKKPNGWGLYDMHGNVWEWVQDWKASYSSGSSTDPSGPSSGSVRVFRGGGWNDPARYCRSASRGWGDPGFRSIYLGFRLARGL